MGGVIVRLINRFGYIHYATKHIKCSRCGGNMYITNKKVYSLCEGCYGYYRNHKDSSLINNYKIKK